MFRPLALVIAPVLLSLVGYAHAFACPPGKPSPPPESPPALERKVQTIFARNCTYNVSCHRGMDDTNPMSADLRNPRSAIGQPSVVHKDRILIIPGNADDSYLVELLLLDPDGDRALMPVTTFMGNGDPLPPDEVQAVKDWINSLPAATPTPT